MILHNKPIKAQHSSILKDRQINSRLPNTRNNFKEEVPYYKRALGFLGTGINELANASGEAMMGFVPFSDKNMMTVGIPQYFKNIANAAADTEMYNKAMYGDNAEVNDVLNDAIVNTAYDLTGSMAMKGVGTGVKYAAKKLATVLGKRAEKRIIREAAEKAAKEATENAIRSQAHVYAERPLRLNTPVNAIDNTLINTADETIPTYSERPINTVREPVDIEIIGEQQYNREMNLPDDEGVGEHYYNNVDEFEPRIDEAEYERIMRLDRPRTPAEEARINAMDEYMVRNLDEFEGSDILEDFDEFDEFLDSEAGHRLQDAIDESYNGAIINTPATRTSTAADRMAQTLDRIRNNAGGDLDIESTSGLFRAGPRQARVEEERLINNELLNYIDGISEIPPIRKGIDKQLNIGTYNATPGPRGLRYLDEDKLMHDIGELPRGYRVVSSTPKSVNIANRTGGGVKVNLNNKGQVYLDMSIANKLEAGRVIRKVLDAIKKPGIQVSGASSMSTDSYNMLLNQINHELKRGYTVHPNGTAMFNSLGTVLKQPKSIKEASEIIDNMLRSKGYLQRSRIMPDHILSNLSIPNYYIQFKNGGKLIKRKSLNI